MKRRLAGLAIAASLVAAAPAANVNAEPTDARVVIAKRCSSGYTHARMPWWPQVPTRRAVL